MPEKKATVAEKKAPARATAAAPKAAAKKKTAEGESYSCRVCGLVVTVDEACGCAEEHAILCCGSPMKPKTTRIKVKAK